MEVQVRQISLIDYQLIFMTLFIIEGVGKSAVIKAVSLHAEKILRQSGHETNSPHVLVCAYTGKAASLVGKLV
jgi:hypothetical protein